ncbi:cytochrome P450 [Citricoccus zhacaiensis]|uniref:Cytochrome P450 n=1 Tax=Citricoccus zhacaiensis TaxID=489142 RepID=A0ABQ2LQX1_9MICC|nr:cytochrome P450 [Citricoccus zhacaiensis]GGO42073.1 cytochrome P450 [Citricoccus zhacaiensis]
MPRATEPRSSPDIPILGPVGHARVLARVLLSPVIKGPIVRRPRVVGLAERIDLDSAGVAEMQRLRSRYGPGPVQLRIPGRRIALLLDPEDVHRVLNEGPEPFSQATLEKRGALNHFEPGSSLVSSAQQRLSRRPFNEQVLETDRPVHSHAEQMTAIITEEVEALLGHADFTGTLDWDGFAVMWGRMVRRIVLGDGAREDDQVTDDLRRLRERGNLSYLMPQNRRLRERFLGRLQEYVDRAESGSLAAMVAQTPAPADAKPVQQMPQWLFAFDAEAWATFRALALLVSHPGAAEQVRSEMTVPPGASAAEAAGSSACGPRDQPLLRAAVLESLRLWPTTPLILRDSTAGTRWRNGTLPAGAGLVIFAPFFHRDGQTLPEAHRFSPALWSGDRDDSDWPLVPFSGGPGMCPGRNVVLLTASRVLGELLGQREIAAAEPLDTRRLPGTLSPFHLRFAVRRG